MQCTDLSRARALTIAILVILTGCPDGGLPPCADELSDCSGTCQDLQTDELNCGTCGNACASGQTCEQGQCRAPQPPPCSTGLTSCDGICVNLQTSPSNCGTCGTACASGLCSAGQCVSPSTCGNGAITGTETCDDSNATSGDGCSSSCAIESGWQCQGQPSRCYRGETEPNDSRDTATPVPSQPSLILRGAITPGSDVDMYRLTVTGTADLRIDTFDGSYTGSGPESCETIDTILELISADGSVLAESDDDGVEACSSIRPGLTSAAALLPAGTYFIRVRPFGTTSIPAYTLRIQFQALCGDGTRQMVEQCDDGNTVGGDGCPATCRPEKMPEVENNNSAGEAQVLATLPSLIGGAISPGTDQDMFRFTLNATADLEIETYDGSYTGMNEAACQGIDTVLELIAENGTTILASDDESGIGMCSSLTPSTSRAMKRMAPGTYFTRVTSYGGSMLPAYSVAIRYRSLCGDGLVTGSEECEGGAGCTATCERLPSCGDGYLDYPEACEDGNTVNGDGCSSTCQLPGLQSEVEPNNTRAEADARAGDSSPVLITGTTGFSSAFLTYQDVDIYKLQLQAARTVKLETFHGGLSQCTPGLDTLVTLSNAAGTYVDSDDDGGLGLCSLLELSLQAGTYYVTVERLGADDAESYALQVTIP